MLREATRGGSRLADAVVDRDPVVGRTRELDSGSAGGVLRRRKAMRAEPEFDEATLKQIWSPLAIGMRRRPALVSARALLLDKLGRGDEAVRAIASALKRSWKRELVVAFGEVRAADPLKQLKRAENWLAKRGEDIDLLLAAARLCLRNELWGKARSYLETVIALRPSAEAYLEYGRLLTQLGETDAAADAYRDGLGMAARTSLRAIPHLGPDKA